MVRSEDNGSWTTGSFSLYSEKLPTSGLGLDRESCMTRDHQVQIQIAPVNPAPTAHERWPVPSRVLHPRTPCNRRGVRGASYNIHHLSPDTFTGRPSMP